MMNRKILGLLFLVAMFATLLVSDAVRSEAHGHERKLEAKERKSKNVVKSIENGKNEDGEKEKDINKKKEVTGKKTGHIRVDKGRKTFEGVIGDKKLFWTYLWKHKVGTMIGSNLTKNNTRNYPKRQPNI